MEKGFHLNDTYFLSALVSTEAVEAKGDSTGRRKFPLTGVGGWPVGDSQPYALNAVMVVELATIPGDPGKKYYRNCMTEADVATVAGVSSLVGQKAAETNNILNIFTGKADLPAQVIPGPDATDATASRPVTSMSVSGMGFRDLTRRKKKK